MDRSALSQSLRQLLRAWWLSLGAAFVGLAALAAWLQRRWFPLAYFEVHVGDLVAATILLGGLVTLAIATWWGRKPGRGRVAPACLGLALTLLAAALLFLTCAPCAVRLNAVQDVHDSQPASSVGGAAVMMHGFMGGWLIDLEEAREVAFIPGVVYSADWSPDGETLAVATDSGPLGSVREHPHVRYLDARGEDVLPDLGLPGYDYVAEVRWAGSDVLLIVTRYEGEEWGGWGDLLLVEVSAGETRKVTDGLRQWGWSLVGPLTDGRVLLAKAPREALPTTYRSGVWKGPYSLYEIDLENARLGSELLARDRGSPVFEASHLSPTGRFRWTTSSGEDRGSLSVHDLESGEESPLGAMCAGENTCWELLSYIRKPLWLEGDRLLWVQGLGEERRLMTALPEQGDPRLVREWPSRQIFLRPSPDLRKVYVEWFPKHPEKGEAFVYEPEADRWIPVTARGGNSPHWAGSGALVHVSRWSFVLEVPGSGEGLRRISLAPAWLETLLGRGSWSCGDPGEG